MVEVAIANANLSPVKLAASAMFRIPEAARPSARAMNQKARVQGRKAGLPERRCGAVGQQAHILGAVAKPGESESGDYQYEAAQKDGGEPPPPQPKVKVAP